MRRDPYKRSAADFRSLFAHAPPSSVDLLSKMLRFSASSRISMFDARCHKFHEDTGDATSGSAAQIPVISEEQVHLRWFVD
jgi:hypothetical protein